MNTDWTLKLDGHRPLFWNEDGCDQDYLWTCECGSAGEDIQTRDAHILSVSLGKLVEQMGTRS